MITGNEMQPMEHLAMAKYTEAQMLDRVNLYNLDPSRTHGWKHDNKRIDVPHLGHPENPVEVMKIKADHVIKHSSMAVGEMKGWLTLDKDEYEKYLKLYEARRPIESKHNPHRREEKIINASGVVTEWVTYYVVALWDEGMQQYIMEELDPQQWKAYQKKEKDLRLGMVSTDVESSPIVKEATPEPSEDVCAWGGCENKEHKRGLCQKHYKEIREDRRKK